MQLIMRRRLALLLALAFVAAAAAAEETSYGGARVEQVAEGIYVIIHEDATDEWPHGNTGVVIGRDAALVVDSTYLPSRARADIALIRKLTDKPVRYLAMTHWHFDHNNGNVAYAEAFPGIAVVSERRTRDWIELNNQWWPKMSTAPDSDRRKSLGKLEAQLASGRDDKEKTLTGEDRQRLATTIAARKSELEELSALQVVAPNMTFDGDLTLDLGGRRVELRDRGPANSPHDVTIFVPDAKVLFTGDIVVQARLPYVGMSWPLPWTVVLRSIEAMDLAAIVPGHGPVMRDASYVRRVRELLEAVVSAVTAMTRQGKTLEQIQAAIDVGEHRRRFAPWNEVPDESWKYITDTLSERAWRSVRGQGAY